MIPPLMSVAPPDSLCGFPAATREGEAVIPQRAWRRRGLGVMVGLAMAMLPAGLSPISGWASRAASDGPGNLSHFDLARKDCLGSARNTTSKVWYTVANGVLSDVYYPTADNTNVETLRPVVTHGTRLTARQPADINTPA